MASTTQTERHAPYPHTGWSAWVFIVVAASLMLQPLVEALPKHGPDPSWPAHAHFHLASGLASQFFLGFACVLVARIPYRRGEAWSWWVLAGLALSMIAMIPATLWFGSGPEPQFWFVIRAQIAAMLAGLAMTASMLGERAEP